MPRDKRKRAARALAVETGLPYTAARRAAINVHLQEQPEQSGTPLPIEDVAAQGRTDRLLLGLTWAQAPLWAHLPPRGHVGVFESGFAGSRALCRYLALQARAHGATVHVLAPAGAAAYPGLEVVFDPAACRHLLIDVERSAPAAQNPTFVVVDDPRALHTDIRSRGEAFAAIARLLTRGPDHVHVVLRCEGPSTSWPLSAFAVVGVTGVLGSTWHEVVGEPVSTAATAGPDLWTFLPGPAHRGQGVLDCDPPPASERMAAFVPGAPAPLNPSASRHPHDGALADRDWSRHARVRVVATVDRYSPGARGARFEAGEVLAMHQGGRAGRTVGSAWWTSGDVDGAYIFEPGEVQVIEELPGRSTPPGAG